MSYCRFTNTLSDLEDCFEALQDNNISSDAEKKAATKMLNMIVDFCLNENLIEGEENTWAIKEWIDNCN